LEENLQDIYEMINDGTLEKIIPVPRHSEFSNEFLKDILKEIPRK